MKHVRQRLLVQFRTLAVSLHDIWSYTSFSSEPPPENGHWEARGTCFLPKAVGASLQSQGLDSAKGWGDLQSIQLRACPSFVHMACRPMRTQYLLRTTRQMTAMPYPQGFFMARGSECAQFCRPRALPAPVGRARKMSHKPGFCWHCLYRDQVRDITFQAMLAGLERDGPCPQRLGAKQRL